MKLTEAHFPRVRNIKDAYKVTHYVTPGIMQTRETLDTTLCGLKMRPFSEWLDYGKVKITCEACLTKREAHRG